MVGHGGSSAGSYLADPTSPIPSHCASIVVTSTLRFNIDLFLHRQTDRQTDRQTHASTHARTHRHHRTTKKAQRKTLDTHI